MSFVRPILIYLVCYSAIFVPIVDQSIYPRESFPNTVEERLGEDHHARLIAVLDRHTKRHHTMQGGSLEDGVISNRTCVCVDSFSRGERF